LVVKFIDEGIISCAVDPSGAETMLFSPTEDSSDGKLINSSLPILLMPERSDKLVRFESL